MLEALDEIEKDPDINSVVITSSDPKSWSQGIDLEWMSGRLGENDTQAIKDFMYLLNSLFKRMLLYPMPVIAAINGHAAAGGAIISCACDFRFMRGDRGFFFFPEVDIGIPFLPGMIAFSKKAFPYHMFEEAMLSGRRFSADELEKNNVIIKACEDRDAVLTEALNYARTYNKKRGIFGEMKKRMNKEMIDVLDNVDPEYIESGQLMVE
jgi:enoyl-CoA hydratase/carnithine racemase